MTLPEFATFAAGLAPLLPAPQRAVLAAGLAAARGAVVLAEARGRGARLRPLDTREIAAVADGFDAIRAAMVAVGLGPEVRGCC